MANERIVRQAQVNHGHKTYADYMAEQDRYVDALTASRDWGARLSRTVLGGEMLYTFKDGNAVIVKMPYCSIGH